MASRSQRRRFRKISIKVSDKEYKVLKDCVNFSSTTINKFIKQSIRVQVLDIKPQIKQKKDEDSSNQLSLFDFEQKHNQTSMFEEYKEFYTQ